MSEPNAKRKKTLISKAGDRKDRNLEETENIKEKIEKETRQERYTKKGGWID